MKKKPNSTIIPAALLTLAALVPPLQAAPLMVGTKVGIDLGPTVTANWNNITSNNAGVAAGAVVDLTGTTVDGVAIQTSNAQFTNNDGSNNWTGLSTNGGSAPPEFVDSVTTDISGNFNLGDGTPYTVVISGLDNTLVYDIDAVSTANFSPIDTVSINGGTPSPISRPDAQANGLFHSFTDVLTDGSGNITITVVDTGSGSNPILNGVLIEAKAGGPDNTPPEVLPPTSPEDDATGVLVGTELVVTFDEFIALTGAGTVTIRDLGPGSDVVIDLAGPDPDGTVSVEAATLTISLAADLVANNSYAVQISADAVEDLASPANAFAGILDDTTWNFQTAADAAAPVIVPPTNPVDDASDVPQDASLVASFDEPIVAGNGNITVRNLSEGTETVIPVEDPRVTISGSDLIIDPDANLEPSDDYAVRIDPGAVADITGNPFAGIPDDTTWNFTTSADTVNPTLAPPTVPADEATGVVGNSLVATFSEAILAPPAVVLESWDFESDNGGFTLKPAGGGFTPAGSAWEWGDPDSSSPGGNVTTGNNGSTNCWGTNLGSGDDGHYLVPTVTCLRSPVIDLTGVASARLTFAEALDLEAGDLAVVNIIDDTTEAVIAGAIYTADDSGALGNANWNAVPAIDLAAGIGQLVRIEWCLTGGTAEYLGWYIDDVEITGSSAADSIIVKNLTAATQTTIPSSDSSQVSITGNVLTVTPAGGLELNSSYAIRIGGAAITDLSGNFYAGINDDTTWNFATQTTVPLVVGMKIGLAPGPTPTDDAGNDWFDFSATNTTYDQINNLDGDLVDGVSVQVAGSVGFNTAGENSWVGLSSEGGGAPPEFVDSVTTDLLFNNVTITIGGLDPGLAYDITTISHGGGSSYDNVEDTHTITGDVSYGSSTHTRGEARLNGTFHSFPNVRPDGGGTIVLVTTQPSGTNAAFNGLLLEAVDPVAAGYGGWAGKFAGFSNSAPGTDFDSDGLVSGVEWVVDGDPTVNDAASVAPTFDNASDPNDFLFTFRRRDDAAADPDTTIVVEYGSTLTGWATAQDGVDGITISVDDDGFGTSALDGVGVDRVTVAVPRSLAVQGRLFVRLNVTINVSP